LSVYPGSGATGFSVNSTSYYRYRFADSSGISLLLQDIWEYDPFLNSWARRAYFGGTPRSSATGMRIGKYGFIGFGGDFFNSSLYLNDWWGFNTRASAADYSTSEDANVNKSNGYYFLYLS
jgi:hypothetical protein